MAWEDFLNHKCNIYHIRRNTENLGYGIQSEDKYVYPDEADEENVPCHFVVRDGAYRITQNEPANEYYARIKLTLPIGTDIRINDKIVSGETGMIYIAELPRVIKNHHIIVYVNRQGTIKEAI